MAPLVFAGPRQLWLMTVLMGENMMRRDGEPHLSERRQIFPSVSPRTVRDVWTDAFEADAARLLAGLRSPRAARAGRRWTDLARVGVLGATADEIARGERLRRAAAARRAVARAAVGAA